MLPVCLDQIDNLMPVDLSDIKSDVTFTSFFEMFVRESGVVVSLFESFLAGLCPDVTAAMI
jgi:hypothetical protein